LADVVEVVLVAVVVGLHKEPGERICTNCLLDIRLLSCRIYREDQLRSFWYFLLDRIGEVEPLWGFLEVLIAWVWLEDLGLHEETDRKVHFCSH